jgi:hypothetical protein
MATSKKKSTKQTAQRSEKPKDAETTITFSKETKRLLLSSLGASIGSAIGLFVAEHPDVVQKLIKEIVNVVSTGKLTNGMEVKIPNGSERSAGFATNVWKPTTPPTGEVDNWVDQRLVAIWHASPKDYTEHAFELSFDGKKPGISACGAVTLDAVHFLLASNGRCAVCEKVLTDAGYEPMTKEESTNGASTGPTTASSETPKNSQSRPTTS